MLASSFGATLIAVNDQEHLGGGTVAGTPARWKRASSSGSDSESGSIKSGSTKSGTSASSGGSAGSSAGYQYKLADGNTITSAAELEVGTATYTFEYKTTCTLKEYPEYDGTEATIEKMTAIDKENEDCFDMVTSKIASKM